jgi:signal transduction histidine kinase
MRDSFKYCLQTLNETFIYDVEVMSHASHELITPIIPVIGYTRLMFSGAAGELTEQEIYILKAIQTQVTFFHTQIWNVFDYAKLTTGKKTSSLEKTSRSVNEFIDQIKHMLDDKPQLEWIFENKTSWEKEISADFPHILGCFDRLYNNAVNFGLGKPVIIRIEPNNSTLRISLTDQGIGIASEHHDLIFKPFYQVNPANEGLGLGLYIAKTMIELEGGTLSVESESGKGSTFTITIPVEVEKSVPR